LPVSGNPNPAEPGGLPKAEPASQPKAEPASHAEAGLFTLPNAITFARLCAVPWVVWLVLQHRFDLAFYMFLAAGVSDAVDGWLARVRNARSKLGAILDPVADKALLVSMYVTLAAVGVLPDWLAILVVFRDLVIVGGVLVLYVLGQPPAIQPIMLSKANTVLQIVLVAGALMVAAFTLSVGPLLDLLVLATAATTLASGAVYVWRAARRPR
jgi:cardiolipin synthase